MRTKVFMTLVSLTLGTGGAFAYETDSTEDPIIGEKKQSLVLGGQARAMYNNYCKSKQQISDFKICAKLANLDPDFKSQQDYLQDCVNSACIMSRHSN